jgi:hypothetical protein
MVLLVVFAIGVSAYLLAVAWSAFCYWYGRPKTSRASALPGLFGALIMVASVLSALNERKLLPHNLPDALMGFLAFVAILILGIPAPWFFGWCLASLIGLVAPRSARRRAAEEERERGEKTIREWMYELPGERPGKRKAKRFRPRRDDRDYPD